MLWMTSHLILIRRLNLKRSRLMLKHRRRHYRLHWSLCRLSRLKSASRRSRWRLSNLPKRLSSSLLLYLKQLWSKSLNLQLSSRCRLKLKNLLLLKLQFLKFQSLKFLRLSQYLFLPLKQLKLPKRRLLRRWQPRSCLISMCKSRKYRKCRRFKLSLRCLQPVVKAGRITRLISAIPILLLTMVRQIRPMSWPLTGLIWIWPRATVNRHSFPNRSV